MSISKQITPIFIHSLFRTGSTYIWNKFRQHDRYHCYYEPLHQVMLQVTRDNMNYAFTTAYNTVNHPHLKSPYLQEYKKLFKNGEKGLPFIKKSFPFDEYCDTSENPAFKQYIDYLIAGTEGKIPVLQFNRSALRTRWFRENYANSLNIYLVRAPRDQWQSYNELYNRTNYALFFVMDLLIPSVNQSKRCFQSLSKHIPLLEYHDASLPKEIDFYRKILDIFSLEERYFIFYYLWLKAFIENCLYADFFININLLTENFQYKKEIVDRFREKGVKDIDFEDCKISKYSSYTLSGKVMQEIEEKVQKIVLTSVPADTIQSMFERISPGDAEYFQFSKNEFLEKRNSKYKSSNIQKRTLDKYKNIIFSFSEKNIQQTNENIRLQNEINEKSRLLFKQEQQLLEMKKLLAEKEKSLQQTLKSYSYRVGRIVLFPFFLVKKNMGKVTNNKNKNRLGLINDNDRKERS